MEMLLGEPADKYCLRKEKFRELKRGEKSSENIQLNSVMKTGLSFKITKTAKITSVCNFSLPHLYSHVF